MATSPTRTVLCAVPQVQADLKEATTADITTREVFRVDHIRKLARTFISKAMTWKPDVRLQMATGAPHGSAASTDVVVISPMKTAACVALDQAMATVVDATMMIMTVVATAAAIRATIHTRKPAAMSGDRAILLRLYASPAMAIGTEQLSTTTAIAVDRL
jgi:hypothetical protein